MFNLNQFATATAAKLSSWLLLITNKERNEGNN